MGHKYEPLVLAQLLPQLAEEIARRLAEDAEGAEFAPQVPTLRILSRCGCKEPGCASFTTGARRSGKHPTPVRTIALFSTRRGMSDIIIDVVEGKIVNVEILDRTDIAAVLDEAFAKLRAGTA